MDFSFITHQPVLVGAAVVVASLLLVVEWLLKKQEADSCTPTQLVNILNHEHAKVLDLRKKEIFQQGHILGSHWCDPKTLPTAPVLIQGKEEPVLVLVCQQGLESRQLANTLKGSGFSVRYLKGGLEAWRTEGLPLVKSK